MAARPAPARELRRSLLAARAAPAAAQRADFVRVRDGELILADRPDRLGVNLWYATNLGAEGAGADRARLMRELDRIQRLGVTNVRLMASGEGPASVPFRWSGGMAQYVSRVTGEPIPYPEQHGRTWDEFQNYPARFYALDGAQAPSSGAWRR